MKETGVALRLIRSGARTRTLNNWTRTSCVANYTTPEGLGKLTRDAKISPARAPDAISRTTSGTAEADDATDAHFEGLFQVVLPERCLTVGELRTGDGYGRESLGRRDRHRPVLVEGIGHRDDGRDAVTPSVSAAPIATFCQVSVPRPIRILDAGTPWLSRYVADTPASVKTSPGRLPPVTAIHGARSLCR